MSHSAASGTNGLAVAMDGLEIESESEVHGSDTVSEVHDADVNDGPASSIEEPEAYDSDPSTNDVSEITEHSDTVEGSGHSDSIGDSESSDGESTATGATGATGAGPTKPAPRQRPRKRSRPDRWLREVEHYQSTTKLLIRKAPFKRLVREVAQEYKTDLRFSVESFEALQEASEDFLVELFQKTQRQAVHRGAQTIEPKDMQEVIDNMNMRWGVIYR